MCSHLAAGVYEFRLTPFEGQYDYGQLRELPGLQLGTKLSSVSRVEVEVSGIHSNGWYDAFYGDGLLGASLYVGIGARGDYRTRGRLTLDTDGPFSATFPIPTGSMVPDWSKLLEGGVEVYALNDRVAGFPGGGSVVRAPYLEITSVVLRIDAVPAIHLAYDAPTGKLSWSALPATGRLRLYSAATPDGPWDLAGEYENHGPFPTWKPAEVGSRFFKAAWTDHPLP
jgi:hypothetical protein